MSLKQKQRVGTAVIFAGVLLSLISMYAGLGTASMLLGFAIIFAGVLLMFFWRRCPHCGAYLREGIPRFCPHCGARVNPDAKSHK